MVYGFIYYTECGQSTISMKNKKYFCYEIYKNISIWSTQNGVKYNPCSIYSGSYATTDTVDIGQVWNNPAHQDLKRCVETDTPISGCQVCYDEEAVGRKSRRQSVKQTWEDFLHDTNIDLDKPQGIDYSVGNLCNLKCVICGPNNSTAWISDWEKLYPENNIESYKYNKNIQNLLSDKDTLSNIRSIHFHGGGEPLLSNNHYDLLVKIKEAKGLADVKVFYNCNGTTIPTQQVLDIWEECLLVEIYLSIDDMGERFNYQRTGADWNTLVANIKTMEKILPHNHMFKINCVWSYLNLYYINELYDWYQANLSTNRYGDPVDFILQKGLGPCSISQLPADTKDLLRQRFIGYPQLTSIVDSIPKGNSSVKFWTYVNKLDKIRKTSFNKVCPEWSKLI